RVTLGIRSSVSPGEIDPLPVVWIHGDRDSAPDTLISKERTTKRNGHASDDPHPWHSIPRRRGWFPQRRKRRSAGSKVVVANYNHVANERKLILPTFRPPKERGVNRAAFMNSRANGGRIPSARASGFDTLRSKPCRVRRVGGIKRAVNGGGSSA